MTTKSEEIKTKFAEVKEAIHNAFCLKFEADADDEDAQAINEELSTFVQELLNNSLEPVQKAMVEMVTQVEAKAQPKAIRIKPQRVQDEQPQKPVQVDQNYLDRKFNAVETQLNKLLEINEKLEKQLQNPPPQTPEKIKPKIKKQDLWSRYQKPWNNYRKLHNIPIPIHPGIRSKETADDYKKFQKLPKNKQENFLAEYSF